MSFATENDPTPQDPDRRFPFGQFTSLESLCAHLGIEPAVELPEPIDTDPSVADEVSWVDTFIEFLHEDTWND